MLELGFSELFLVGIVALIIVGPKDLPRMFRVIGKYVGRAKAMARDFQRSFDDAAKDSGFDDIKKNLNTLQDFSPNNIAKNVVKENFGQDKSDLAPGGLKSNDNSKTRTFNATTEKDQLIGKKVVKNSYSKKKG